MKENDSDTNGLRIIRLEAENFKKLRAVEVTPNGDMVIVSGKNGAGKSSLLDSIYSALAGAKGTPKVPVRRGQERAFVKVSLGRDRVQLVVTREFTAGGSVLRVESPEGARFPSPQTMLDALLGELTFDPLAFMQRDERGKYEALRKIVPLDVDPDQIDGLNRADYDTRTLVNKDARAARANADTIKVTDGVLPGLVDVSALKDRMAEASTINADIEKRRGRRESAAQEALGHRDGARGCLDRAADLRRQVERAEEEAAGLVAKAEAIERRLEAAEPLPEPVDASAIRLELDQAETSNRVVAGEFDRRNRRTELVAKADQLEQQAKKLTDAMKSREQTKTEAIARAPMPVDGLGFGEGLVTFGGVPFDQASSAEQLRVSVAIAMAANPRLRVIRIKEGSLLDSDNVALIAEMAHESGYQVWMECIEPSSALQTVLIEDGMLVKATE